MQIKTGNIFKYIVLLIFFTAAASLFAQTLSLSAELEDTEIWLGDSVRLNLYLQGSEEQIAPDLAIQGITISPLGGTVRSSRSVTSINGKVTQNVKLAYVYSYKLTPVKTGIFTVPSITANIDGQLLSSNPVSFTVKEPEKSDDFYLQLNVDRGIVYLNEEVSLKVHFRYKSSLRSLSIRIPELNEMEYRALEPSGNSEMYELDINDSPVIFERDDRGGVAGLTAELMIRPGQTGSIEFNNSTAVFEAVTGYQNVHDFFGRVQRQEVYGKFVIPGDAAVLNVLPFPEKGKPVDFFGLSGDIRLNISAEPLSVHLGDPITLSLNVSGMNNTDIGIPPLTGYLGSGIDIPDTRAAGKTGARSRSVTQTIRITDPDLKYIPQIRFSYFDTNSGEYRYAETDALPLEVLETRTVTAGDLEGDSAENENNKVVTDKKKEGIYYNYTGVELLENSRPFLSEQSSIISILLLLIIPPAVFFAVLIVMVFVPQFRQNAVNNLDRRKALKKMRKDAEKAAIKEPVLYLKSFIRTLDGFLMDYGDSDDEHNIADELSVIQAVLYGGRHITSTEAGAAVFSLIGKLEKAGVKS